MNATKKMIKFANKLVIKRFSAEIENNDLDDLEKSGRAFASRIKLIINSSESSEKIKLLSKFIDDWLSISGFDYYFLKKYLKDEDLILNAIIDSAKTMSGRMVIPGEIGEFKANNIYSLIKYKMLPFKVFDKFIEATGIDTTDINFKKICLQLYKEDKYAYASLQEYFDYDNWKRLESFRPTEDEHNAFFNRFFSDKRY